MKGGKSKAAAPKMSDTKLSVKRGADKPRSKPAKRVKPAVDPNKPKRSPSAFFVFMEEFRETFKKKNPGEKRVAVVGKAGGEKWKSLSDSEKAPFVARANKLKAEYDKKMVSYNKKESAVANKKVVEEEEEEESDKSKSEVNDDEDDEGSDEDEDADEDDD